MKIVSILIASHNPAKLKELKKGLTLLHKEGIKILSLNDLMITAEPKETGKTFEENSIFKARFYGNLTKLPTIADDGGLMIDSLGNEPGVKSKRWLNREASDEELIAYTLQKLQGLSKEKRTAHLKTVVCFYDPASKVLLCEKDQINGYIAQKPSSRRIAGYPYRSLFIVDKYNKYYDELSEKEHDEINHRLKAMRALVKKINPEIKIA